MNLNQRFSVAAFTSIALIVSLARSLTIPTPSQPPQPDRPLNVETVPGDEHWLPSFILNGSDRLSTLATDGTNLYAGGWFSIIGGVFANGIAKWDASTNRWSALGGGMNNSVWALAFDRSGNLYAGGDFTAAGSVAANHIAKWDGSSWSALGIGTNDRIDALAVDDNGNVYVGGSFSMAGSVPAGNVAKWNVSTHQWEAMGDGLDGRVSALAADRNGNIYAGGVFTAAGGVGVNNVARWDGNTWVALGAGITGGSPDGAWVSALAVDDTGNLYVGGYFTLAGTVNVNNIAMWDGSIWSALSSGLSGGLYTTSPRALAVVGGNLYAAGDFTMAGGIRANNVARWNGNNWEALGSGTNDMCTSLAIDHSGNVYVGGSFTAVGDAGANGIARWDGQSWSIVGFDNSLNYLVSAIAVDQSDQVYAGGAFTTAGGKLVNHVARWDGSEWSALGEGISGNLENCDPSWFYACVLALSMGSGSNLYMGGTFTMTAGINTNHIAKWDGSSWSALSTGTDGTVTTIATDDSGNVYAGGIFSMAGGAPANNIAKWNVSTHQWEALDAGLGGIVWALATDGDGNLYAGGEFTHAGDFTVNHVAKWNGSAWSALGTGVCCGYINKGGYDLTHISALALDSSGNLYVGGDFSQAGGISAEDVAMWDGSNWQALGSGITCYEFCNRFAFAVDTSDHLIVGGNHMSTAGDISVHDIASWDGSSWSAFGSGVDCGWICGVFALAVDNNRNIYAGGSFEIAGGKPSANFAKWTAQIFQAYFPLVAR